MLFVVEQPNVCRMDYDEQGKKRKGFYKVGDQIETDIDLTASFKNKFRKIEVDVKKEVIKVEKPEPVEEETKAEVKPKAKK